MNIRVVVLVDGEIVATVPCWLVKHAIEDVVVRYPDKIISLEVLV